MNIKNSLISVLCAASLAAASQAAVMAPVLDPPVLPLLPPDPLTAHLDFGFAGVYSSQGDVMFPNGHPFGLDPQLPLPTLPPLFGAAQLGYAFSADPNIDLGTDYNWILNLNLEIISGSYVYEDANGGIQSGLIQFPPLPPQLPLDPPLLPPFMDGSLSPTELWLQADLSGVFGPFSIDDAALFLTGGSLDAFGVWLALESFFTSVNYPFVNFVGPVGYAANGGFPAGVIDFALLDSFPVGGFPLPPDAELLSVSDFEVRGGLSIEFKPVAVPEPSTYGLIGAGILGCLIAFRRYRINRINTAENLD